MRGNVTYAEITERGPTDGVSVGSRGFPISAFCIVPFQLLLSEVSQPEAPLGINFPFNGMARRLEANIRQKASWEV
jgi:hypothetical protein